MLLKTVGFPVKGKPTVFKLNELVI